MIEIVFYSLIIGAIGGGCIAAGAARMNYAPKIQSMGAFRTLGELNACAGDPAAHFSFGLGFFFNAAAASVAAGCLSQDVLHRIVPNWSAGLLLLKNKDVNEALWNPARMMVTGAGVGAVVVTFLNTVASAIPEKLSEIAANVLTPATGWLINPVMPAIFWLAALDAGKFTGFWGTVLGGVSAVISGNAVPGVVLGILLGKTAEDSGYNSKMFRILLVIIVVMFGLIGYFRGFWGKLFTFGA